MNKESLVFLESFKYQKYEVKGNQNRKFHLKIISLQKAEIKMTV